jgi:hypothetical protein
MELIPFIAGVLLPIGIAGFGKVTRFEQDRSFYPTILIVIASYYVLLAILGDSRHALYWESAVAVAFSVIGIFGSLRVPLLAGAAIAAHGLFDLVHQVIIQNPGVPSGGLPFALGLTCPWVWVMSSLYRLGGMICEKVQGRLVDGSRAW